MRYLIISILFLTSTRMSAHPQEETLDEQAHIAQANSEIHRASDWIIRHGVETFVQYGEQPISRKMIDE